MKDDNFSHCYDNGLALVARKMPWLRSAAFTLLLPAGCAREPADRGGLAAFLCEMAERGAGPRDSRQFILDLDNLGVEWSEFVSAAHTGFRGATTADNLAPALRIYADVVQRPRLPAEQIDAARAVMMHELRGVEDDPAQKTLLELRRRHYGDPWGRSSQGEQTAIEAIDSDDLAAFYRACYHPQGAILGVAGQFDFPAVRDLVGELFADWRGPDEQTIADADAQARSLHLPYESSQTHIGIAYNAVPYRHADYFQAWGATGVLSGGMSARLFTNVREKRGLCYSIHASYHTLRDRAAVFCHAGTTAERAQETLDVTLDELRRLGEGIRPDELGRLKARIKSGLIMQQESSSARSGSAARDWYHLGRLRPIDELQALVDGLTCESINAYLSDHPPSDFTIVTLGPEPLEVPRDLP